MLRTIAAAALAASTLAAALPGAALADQRSYAHTHAQPQPAVDPATAAVIGLAVEVLGEVIRQKQIEKKKKCYDAWGYYIC